MAVSADAGSRRTTSPRTTPSSSSSSSSSNRPSTQPTRTTTSSTPTTTARPNTGTRGGTQSSSGDHYRAPPRTPTATPTRTNTATPTTRPTPAAGPTPTATATPTARPTPAGARTTPGSGATPYSTGEHYRDAYRPPTPTRTATTTSTVSGAGPANGAPRQIGQVTPGFFADDASVIQNGGHADDRYFDGAVIGAGGRVYAPGTDARVVAPIRPNNGRTPTNETIYYVNGIQNNAAFQAGSAQNIANATGANVVAIHNSTGGPGGGMAADLGQCFNDKIGLRDNNPATQALANQILRDVEAGRPVHVMAHSQGALVTSGALNEVKTELIREHGAQRADELLKNIKVETFGGAASTYPYGPRYVHYVNRYDPVAMAVGLGGQSGPQGPGSLSPAQVAHAGGDRAALHYIEGDARDHGDLFSAHDFNQGYLSHRQEFADGLANNDPLLGPSPVGRDGHLGETQPSDTQLNISRGAHVVGFGAMTLGYVAEAGDALNNAQAQVNHWGEQAHNAVVGFFTGN